MNWKIDMIGNLLKISSWLCRSVGVLWQTVGYFMPNPVCI